MARKSGVKFTVKAHGVDDVLRALGKEGAKELTKELDQVVERHAIKIANDAKHNAPHKSGKLQGSIRLYGRPGFLSRIIGSNVDYARRQEYEHATKKAFFRKALWKGRVPFRKAIEQAIKRRGR